MHTALAEVLKHPGIWRGDGYSQAAPDVIDCHYAGLARQLPGGGWPQAAVSEMLVPRIGSGELKVLLPALAGLTRAGRQVVLIAPPHIPYAPAWQAAGVDMRRLIWVAPAKEQEAQWAMEQALREPACGAVVGWFAHALADRQCRRLQLAAEVGGGCGFVLHQGLGDTGASPFALRLSIEAVSGGVAVRVIKRRGMPAQHPVFILHRALNQHRKDHALVSPAFSHASTRRLAPRSHAHAS
jgi:cell division inhibitor SulA